MAICWLTVPWPLRTLIPMRMCLALVCLPEGGGVGFGLGAGARGEDER